MTINVNSQYFVALNGNDNNPGTLNEPWATWNKAFLSTSPGDTVYFRGGVYYSTERIGMQRWTCPRWFSSYTRNGTSDSLIVYMGYPPDVQQGNLPILDCSQHCDYIHKTTQPHYDKSKINTSPYNPKYNAAITLVNAEYIHLKDLHIRNVYQCDYVMNAAIVTIGRNLKFENITVENVGQMGFWHISTAFPVGDSAYFRDNNIWALDPNINVLFNMISSRTTVRPLVGSDTLLPAFWRDTIHSHLPDTTRWVNCDVFNICDTLNYGDMSGYSCYNDMSIQDTGLLGDAWKVTSFNGNYYSFEGCRAWNFSGDGFDVRGGKITFDNCWAMGTDMFEHFNKPDGFVTSAFNSNLFSYYEPEYQLQLLQDTTVQFRNCLAMFCGGIGFHHGKVGDISNNPVFFNNTSYGNGTGYSSHINGYDTIGDIFHNNIAYNSDTNISISANYMESHNTWSTGINVNDDDFLSVDQTELYNLFTAPRNLDGSLPDSIPLMLAMWSTLINSGLDVGLGYNGSAPDIGYSETNYDDVNQNIELMEGWNIASFFVSPHSRNMLSVVNPLIEESTLVKIQDEGGNFVQDIYPYGWLNTIGDMSNEEGYYFNVNQNTNFDVSGQPVTLPFNVGLYTGWNILGYPVNANQNALNVLQPLINDSTVIKVISEEGGFIQYIPPYGWLNTIGDFKPDKGYLIKLTTADTLSYNTVFKSTIAPTPDKAKTNCFTNPQGNPYMPMNILINKITTRWFKLENGDELAVYDDDMLVGSIVINDSNEFQMIIAKADDPTTEEKDGFTVGNEILFRYCDRSENKIYEDIIAKYKWGDETFANLGTYLGRLRIFGDKLKYMLIETDLGITYLNQNYPNPFNNNTTIEYGLNGSGRVKLTITDMSGHVLNVLEDEHKLEGDYSVYFINNLKPGFYLYHLEFTYINTIFVQTKKMITY